MKRFIFLMLIVSIYDYGQQNEFKVHANGLIYDQATMQRLGTIVDSLNIKFRSCDLAHPYYSFPQGMATLIKVPSKAALKLIQSGASFETYLQHYPKSVESKIWLVKTSYRDYSKNKFIEYVGLPYGWNQEPSIAVKDKKSNDKSTGWIADEEEMIAFHFPKLQAYTLPFEYARLVQYVDCMIDTTAEIYFPQAEGRVYQQVEKGSKASEFVAWAEQFPNRPVFPDYEKLEEKQFSNAYTTYSRKHRTWDSLRMLNLDRQMEKSSYGNNLLAEAADESITLGSSSDPFEYYVARYLSKEKALQLMRSRKVIGNCSMDQSPRYHAMSICQLAAETAQWDIFLHSHLDIMNDRFERMSDGSYAWAGRKTYLKELEELDIPAIDLLLGTTLRVANVSDKHYWSSIGRVGRALADAADANELEMRLLKMIQDDKLDPYNRLLMAYLFSNYAASLEDESRRAASQKKLDETVQSMPEYMRTVWEKE